MVKLTRVVLLAPALAAVSLLLGRGEDGRASFGLPWFVLAFFAVAGVNSLGVIPADAGALGGDIAAALLACAVAATGIRSPMAELMTAGPRPLLVIAVPTLVALLLSILAAASIF